MTDELKAICLELIESSALLRETRKPGWQGSPQEYAAITVRHGEAWAKFVAAVGEL